MKVVAKLRPADPYNEELLGVIAAAQGKFAGAIRHQKRVLEDKHYADRQSAKARARLTAYEGKTLYLTARSALYNMRLNIPGIRP